MPLTFGSWIKIPVEVALTPTQALAAPRVMRYRFELLDNDEGYLGELANVEPGGSLEWTAFSAIKGSGRITVIDDGTFIDWPNVRIRVWAVLEDFGETPLGVYLCAAPVEDWTAFGRSWSVELLDKNSIPDQDIPTDDVGNPVTYSAIVDSNITALVMDLLIETGEAVPAIEIGDKALAASQVWDHGTTRLQIINDLLSTGNYFSLWTDGMGQFQLTPYLEPADRPPVYEGLWPFSDEPTSLMHPDWKRDRDIYSIPNRYVAISQGSGEVESMVAVATNEDLSSPFSYQNRGRWITRTVTGVEVSTEADLLTRARMGLAQSTSVTSGLTISHPFLPDLLINSTIRFKVGTMSMLCTVGKTMVPLDPNALCTSEIREVVV